MIRFIYRLFAAVDVAGFAALKLIPFAAADRGYWAVGGEWCLIIALAWVGMVIGDAIADVVGVK